MSKIELLQYMSSTRKSKLGFARDMPCLHELSS